MGSNTAPCWLFHSLATQKKRGRRYSDEGTIKLCTQHVKTTSDIIEAIRLRTESAVCVLSVQVGVKL